MYSSIKYKSSIIDGAKHLFNEIELVRTICTTEEKKVAFKVIQDNAYFAHPENVILAMCGKFDPVCSSAILNFLHLFLTVLLS